MVITLCLFLNGQEKDIKLSSVLSKEIRLPKLVETIINKIGRYGLDCQTTHYSAIVTGGFN